MESQWRTCITMRIRRPRNHSGTHARAVCDHLRYRLMTEQARACISWPGFARCVKRLPGARMNKAIVGSQSAVAALLVAGCAGYRANLRLNAALAPLCYIRRGSGESFRTFPPRMRPLWLAWHRNTAKSTILAHRQLPNHTTTQEIGSIRVLRLQLP